MRPFLLTALAAVLGLTSCGSSNALTFTPIRGTHASGAWQPEGTCQRTITQGASQAFAVQGVSRVTAQAYTPSEGGYASRLAVSVDGGPWQVVEAPIGDHAQQVMLVPSISTARHNVRVVVSGIHEDSPFWQGQAGLVWCGVEGDAFLRQQEPAKTLLAMGDSITAGIVVRGHGTSPDPASIPAQSAGELAWPYLTATALGMNSFPVAFGGSGITVAGNGGAPSALEQFKRLAPDKADLVILNYGVNDAGHQAKPEAYIAGYTELIAAVRAKYPSAKVVLMGAVAGNQELNPALERLAREMNLTYIGVVGITTVDGTHPDSVGNERVAAQILKVLRP